VSQACGVRMGGWGDGREAFAHELTACCCRAENVAHMTRIHARFCTPRATPGAAAPGSDSSGGAASSPSAAVTAPAVMTTVYVEEAHPADGWALPYAQTPIGFRQPRSTEERCAVAKSFVSRFDFRLPIVVDSIRNEADAAFDAWPERLYIVVDGVIVYQVTAPCVWRERERE